MIVGGKTRACKLAILLIVLASSFTLPSEGRMGYDIKATVDSTTWVIHRSTQELTFTTNCSTIGDGKFSRYARIQNIGGMNSKDSSYALSGSVYNKEALLLKAIEGPVYIKTDFDDYYIYTDSLNNTTFQLSTGFLEIQENWPTYVASYKQTRYLGPGIRTKEMYENNGDVVTSSVNSWKLNKESLFKAYLNKTVIRVDLAPSSIVEKRFYNKSSSYRLGLQTTGDHASLGVVRNKHFNASSRFGRTETDYQIYQEYVGNLNMSLAIKMDDYIIIDTPDDEWLTPCCFGGYLTMPTYYQKGSKGFGSDAKDVFDCTCWKEPGECGITGVQY
jgi:hypothetical protein